MSPVEFYCLKRKETEIFMKMGGAGRCSHGGDAGGKGKHPVLFCRCRSWLWRLLLSTWQNLESPWRWASEQQVRDYLHLVSLWAWLLKFILTSWTVGQSGHWGQTHSLGWGSLRALKGESELNLWHHYFLIGALPSCLHDFPDVMGSTLCCASKYAC